ncbi:hypothetical protein Tco_0251222 [Tanacetum coccineum]
MNVEAFREILNICPKVSGKAFDEPPTEEEALSFIRELGHTGGIKYITDVIVDHLHQPWITFASIINKCLYGKVSGLEKIRLSIVQILWGMYYKKNQDFVTLIWEDLAYQIDNIDSKNEPQSQGKPKENPIQNISSEESLPKKKGKGLNVLLEVALSEAAQLKEATKRSKKDLYISQASGSGDGTSFESRVPDEK